MANAAQPVLGGPEFLRLLARLSDGAMPASSPALTDRLGQWVDWSRAVALSGALGGRLPEPGEAAEGAEDVLADCAQAHASLLASIREDAEAERLLDLAEAAAAPNFASLRQRYRVLQQAIQTATGRLRGRLRDQLSNLSNFGGYFPQYRAVNESHCTSIIEFANSDIQEQNLQLDHFVDNLLNGSGAVLSASESSDAADKAKPFNLLYYILDQLL